MSWDFFPEHELVCKCGCQRAYMDEEFMRKLIALREAAGFPFIVTSGFRCPQYNEIKSATGRTGPHTTGKAIDIHLFGRQAHWMLEHAVQFGMTGIGISQKGEYKSRFIHLDDLPDAPKQPRPWVWTY